MPPFSTSLKSFLFAFLSYLAAYFPVSCVVPCCPQHKSATHYSVFLLLTIIPSISLHFWASIPSWTAPSPKDLSPGANVSISTLLDWHCQGFRQTQENTQGWAFLPPPAVTALYWVPSSLAVSPLESLLWVTLRHRKDHPSNLCPVTSRAQHATQA